MPSLLVQRWPWHDGVAHPAQTFDSLANTVEIDLEHVGPNIKFGLPDNLSFSNSFQWARYSGNRKGLDLKPTVRLEVANDGVRAYAETGKRNRNK